MTRVLDGQRHICRGNSVVAICGVLCSRVPYEARLPHCRFCALYMRAMGREGGKATADSRGPRQGHAWSKGNASTQRIARRVTQGVYEKAAVEGV